MTFWDDVGAAHEAAGGTVNSIAGNYNQAQVLAMAGIRGANATQVHSGGHGLLGTVLNAPFKAAGKVFTTANSGLGWAFDQVLHGFSTGFNVGDVANEHGESAFHALYSFTDWKNAWNETSGHTVVNPDGTIKPGFGTSVTHTYSEFAPHSLMELVNPGAAIARIGGDLANNTGDLANNGSIFGTNPENVAARQAMLKQQDTWTGKIMSGAIDMAAVWKLDPTRVIAKPVELAKAASRIPDTGGATEAYAQGNKLLSGEAAPLTGAARVFTKPSSPEGLFSSSMTESGNRDWAFIQSTRGGENMAGRDQFVQRTPDTAPILSLFRQADKIEDPHMQDMVKLDVIYAARGVADARARLIQNAPEIARALMREGLTPEGRDVLDGLYDTFSRVDQLNPAALDQKGMDFASAARSFATPENMDELTAYGHHLDNIHQSFRSLGEIADNTPIEGAGLTALDRAKANLRNHVVNEVYYQDGTAGMTVRAIHWATSQRYRGVVDIANPVRGKQELMDYMLRQRWADKRDGELPNVFSADDREKIGRQFEVAQTKLDRSRIVNNVHDELIDRIGTRYGKSREEIRAMQLQRAQTYDNATQFATEALEKARLNGEDRVVLMDPTKITPTSIDRALFSTHISNNAVLPPINQIQDLVLSHQLGGKNVDWLSGAAGQFNTVMDKYNDLWRLFVLARPGLILRTQIDTQGRAMATMGATRIVSNALRGLGHAYNAKFSGEQMVQLSVAARDLHAADMIEAEADKLKWMREHAEPGATNMPDFIGPVPNIEARGKSLTARTNRNQIEDSGTRPVMAGDDYTHLGIPVPPDNYQTLGEMADREQMLRKKAAEVRDTKQWGNRYALGFEDEFLTIGGRRVAYRGHYSAQEMADINPRLYKGNVRPSEAFTQHYPKDVQGLLQDATSMRQARIYENADNYITHVPNAKFWHMGWTRATDHIRNTETGRMILRHGDIGTVDLVHMLQDSKKVRREFNEVRDQHASFLDYIARAIDHVSYLAPTADIRARLLSGRIDPAEVDKSFAKMSSQEIVKGKNKPKTSTIYTKANPEDTLPERMYVQGPEFSPLPFAGQERHGLGIKDQMSKFVSSMSDKPDLAWGRHPVYLNQRRKHFVELAQRQFDQNPSWEMLPHEVQAKIERVATHRAIQDVQQLMYDTAKHTGAHATLRYLSPFMGAWQDAMESWGRLFYDDPRRAGAFWKVWNTPNYMGLIVDENGDPVAPGQTSNASYLLLPMSLDNNYKNSKKWQVRKDSLNSIFQGAQWYTPGFGPIVQLPVQEIIARTYPELGDSSNPIVKSILPFGTPKLSTNPNKLMGLTEDVIENGLPGYGRILWSMWDPSDPNNIRTYQSSINQQIINANKNGKDVPSKQELDKKAVAHVRITGLVRAMSLFGFGVSGQQTQAADFYKTQYDKLQANSQALYAQGSSPSAKFAEMFPEAAGLQWSITKTTTGITASIKAYDASKKFGSEIAANPQYGWFYVGAQNLGNDNFSGSVYNAQVSSGDRKVLTRDQVLSGSLAEQGWNKYNAFQTALKQKLNERGLYSVSQAGANDLQDIRSQFIDSLRKENNAWAQDFDVQDEGKLKRFVDAVAVPALTDPKLKDRADIQLLGQYLQLRQAALDELNKQGYKSLSSNAAQSYRAILQRQGDDMASQSLGFQQVWNRVLQKEVEPTAKDIFEAGQ